MSSSPYLQYLYNTFEKMYNQVSTHPFTDMKFLVPVVLILCLSFVVRQFSVAQKVDSSPTLEKKREKFTLPNDRFNLEVGVIMREDYNVYVRAMESDMRSVDQIRKRFVKQLKKYRKFDILSRSPFSRRKKKGDILRKSMLNDLIDTYTEIKRLNLTVISVDLESV